MTKNPKILAHEACLKARAIDRFCESEIFNEMWEVSDEALKTKVLFAISKQNLDSLRYYIHTHPKFHICDRSNKWLMQMARELGITRYTQMIRSQLIRAIEIRIEKMTNDQVTTD